ncbi:hypothetical protein F2P81_015545 [Scophthalmus maximus]|uniref:Zonadhesin n=1 Tax=Scophthalmus maximus TaxID=52904 RepID=A0A6A4SL35_SCOMX|nr:hypothetical protein F2P81_015545 [Scophthalmus maximus]
MKRCESPCFLFRMRRRDLRGRADDERSHDDCSQLLLFVTKLVIVPRVTRTTSEFALHQRNLPLAFLLNGETAARGVKRIVSEPGKSSFIRRTNQNEWSDDKRTIPVAKRTIPVVKRTIPVVKRTIPVVKRTIAVVKRTIPVVKRTIPVVKRTIAVVKRTIPVVKRTIPVVKRTIAVVKRTIPVVKRTIPVVKRTIAVVKRTIPVVKRTIPVVKRTIAVSCVR